MVQLRFRLMAVTRMSISMWWNNLKCYQQFHAVLFRYGIEMEPGSSQLKKSDCYCCQCTAWTYIHAVIYTLSYTRRHIHIKSVVRIKLWPFLINDSQNAPKPVNWFVNAIYTSFWSFSKAQKFKTIPIPFETGHSVQNLTFLAILRARIQLPPQWEFYSNARFFFSN